MDNNVSENFKNYSKHLVSVSYFILPFINLLQMCYIVIRKTNTNKIKVYIKIFTVVN